MERLGDVVEGARGGWWDSMLQQTQQDECSEYVKTYLGVGMEHSINIARCSFNILQGT